MTDRRLIEDWLPIAELGIESTRERTPMTPFPAPNRLHVWWARRPLVASRAAVLASLLPADADHEKFLHVLGIHGDPVATREKINSARRRGERFEGQAYSYPRAFGHVPQEADVEWISAALGASPRNFAALDPTAGGGSIPFEALRLGAKAVANDLNPVSALIMRATVEWPSRHGRDLGPEFAALSRRFVLEREERLAPHFPQESEPDAISTNFLWARTITCPYCAGLVPLSPNWRLTPGGTGVRLKPELASGPGSEGRVCSFEIVENARDQSPGTVSRGDGACPYPDCGRVVDGGEIKSPGPGRRHGRAALRGRVQEARAGQAAEVRQTRQGPMGSGLPGAGARGRQRRGDRGEARREAAGVGGARHRAERAVSGRQQDDGTPPLRDAGLARPVLAAPASLSRTSVEVFRRCWRRIGRTAN